MRTFPFDPSKAAGLPSLVTIQRGLVTIRFTTWQQSVTSNTFFFPTAPGANLTGFQFPSDGSQANADVSVMVEPGGIVEPGDGVRGVLDNWPILIELFDPNNLSAGTLPILLGTIGSVDEDTRGMATIAADGQLRLASQRPLTEQYTLTGREDLGDDRCKIPLCVDQDITKFDIQRGQTFQASNALPLLRVADAFGRFRTGSTVEDYHNIYLECTTGGVTDPTTAPSYPTSAGGTVTDGSASFIARNAWTRAARGYALDPFTIQFTELDESRSGDPTWFVLGGIFIRSGALDGFPKLPVRAWNPGASQATLFLPVSPTDVASNTQMEIHAGCNLTRDQCFSRFNNIINLRAETFVPPPNFHA